jgi:hypothetical protein
VHRGLLVISCVVTAVVLVAVLTPAPLVSQRSDSGPGVDPALSPPVAERGCGSDVTPEEAQRYLEILAEGGFQLSPDMAPPPYCVPIAGHIVRRTNGTGGLSLSQYFQSIDDANFYFANSGIQFYSLGIDYIDDDDLFNETAGAEIDILRQMNVVPAAINVYYAPNLTGLCGISSFTFSSVQGIVMDNDCSGVPSNPSTMPHEIGHYFNLYHTHETAFGAELVNGSNCGSAGDLLCDTPADPNLFDSVTYPSCFWGGSATDANGDLYDPDEHQIMSYTTPLCADIFSPQSETRAVNVLVNQRASLLSRGCTPVAPPTLTAITPPQGFVDQSKDVVLVGADLASYTYVDFGDGVTVNATTEITSDSLLVNLTIDAAASEGFRDVIVNNAFDPDTLCFTVRAEHLSVRVSGRGIQCAGRGHGGGGRRRQRQGRHHQCGGHLYRRRRRVHLWRLDGQLHRTRPGHEEDHAEPQRQHQHGRRRNLRHRGLPPHRRAGVIRRHPRDWELRRRYPRSQHHRHHPQL